MSVLWRGFAGLVVALGLVFFISQIEDEYELERQLIFETDPKAQAEAHFEANKYVFYRIRATRYITKSPPVRYWLLRGQPEIDQKLLEAYPLRHDLKSSDHYDNMSEQTHFSNAAKKWTLIYNLRLAELLTEKDSR